jgi:hypothetical protein
VHPRLRAAAATQDETDKQLKHALRFQLACDDNLFDDSMVRMIVSVATRTRWPCQNRVRALRGAGCQMPRKLARFQVRQACMYVLIYYYAVSGHRMHERMPSSDCLLRLQQPAPIAQLSGLGFRCAVGFDNLNSNFVCARILAQTLTSPSQPCTRALQQFWMCRGLAGSGSQDDPEEVYRARYLKRDMSYACWSEDHWDVLALAGAGWLLYAVAFPAALLCVIARHKARTDLQREQTGEARVVGATLRVILQGHWLPSLGDLHSNLAVIAAVFSRNDGTAHGQARSEQKAGRLSVAEAAERGRAKADYWTDTQPVQELFWLPVVSHLQPQFWWFFIVEFFRKVTAVRASRNPSTPPSHRPIVPRLRRLFDPSISQSAPLTPTLPPGLYLLPLHPRLPVRRQLQLEARGRASTC